MDKIIIEATLTEKVTVEDLQQVIIDSVIRERGERWERADAVRFSLEKARSVLGMSRLEAANAIGTAIGKSAHWAFLEERMALVYPEAYRYPDVDLYLYRSCLPAEDPVGLLLKAVGEGWTAKDVKAYLDSLEKKAGKKVKTRIVLRGQMSWPSHVGVLTINPEDVEELSLPDGLDSVKVKATIVG